MFRYFFWTTFIFLLSVGVLVFTLMQLDPMGPQALVALLLFFTSLLGTVFSVSTYLFFFGAELYVGRNLPIKNFQHSLRRGVLLSIFITAIVVLRLFNLLGWMEGVLLTFLMLLIELIFSTDAEIIPQK